MKKILPFLLSICLVVTLIPIVSFATDEDVPADDGNAIQAQETEDVTAGDDIEVIDPAQDVVDAMEGESNQTGWVQDTTGWRYYTDDVTYLTGMQTIGGSVYLFNQTGYLQIGLQTYAVDGCKYYFDPTPGTPGGVGSTYGVRMTGWVNVPNVGTCYFNPMMMYGWQTITGKKYYLDPNTGVRKTGWLTIGDSKYYLDLTTGVLKTGWQTIDNKKYYMDPSTGAMQKGWITVNRVKYYMDPTTGVMKTGWLTLNSKKYYLNTTTGRMATAWTTISGKKYFFDTNDGHMVKGWLTYKSKKYYLNPDTGVVVTGLKTISSVLYYFQSSGAMKTNGAVKLSGKLYYFQSNGKAYMKKGWFKGSDKKKRYSLGKGVVQTGTKKISSKWYQFSTTTGACLRTIGDDFDKKVQGKSSSTRYLIAVKRSSYNVRVYTGSKNNWNRKYSFDCSVGTSSSPTKAGTFKINKKEKYGNSITNGVKTRQWYVCYYNGNKGIHSGLYYRDSSPSRAYDTRLRVKASQGSVRLSLNNSQWVYYNCPINTTVVVY